MLSILKAKKDLAKPSLNVDQFYFCLNLSM
jgi:hypothetical protein